MGQIPPMTLLQLTHANRDPEAGLIASDLVVATTKNAKQLCTTVVTVIGVLIEFI